MDGYVDGQSLENPNEAANYQKLLYIQELYETR
jgi:hypothetical protein